MADNDAPRVVKSVVERELAEALSQLAHNEDRSLSATIRRILLADPRVKAKLDGR